MIILIDKITMLKIGKQISALAVVAFLLVSCDSQKIVVPEGANNADAEKNLSQQTMDAVLWSSSSAEAYYSYLQTYELATIKLNNALSQSKSDKPYAVIMDLDETVLDNSQYQLQLLKQGKTFSSGTWSEWVSGANATDLPGSYDFVNGCRSKGIEIFYISNRSVETMNSTIMNLKSLNFPYADEDHVYLKEGGESDKTERRNRVFGHYEVLLILGDNLADFSEAFAERGTGMGVNQVVELRSMLMEKFILFPNPMYGPWMNPFYSDSSEGTLNKKEGFVESKITEFHTIKD